jgi:2-isopropylmalate synthase
MFMEPVLLYDTTLRDGAQGEEISFTVEDKISITKRLDDLGVHYIEGGWPGSNPRDIQYFEMVKKIQLKTATITAFGSTRRPGILPENDTNLDAMLQSQTPAVAIFGKTWDLHVEQVISTTLEENLAMIADSVKYLKMKGREVIYDAEHFFDGYKGNPDYAIRTLIAANDSGADFLVLCDTNGGTIPFEIENIMDEVREKLALHYGKTVDGLSIRFGIHAHNDCNLAVANTISGVQKGASMVQGTINGYGERCGNADLTSIIPILKVKIGNSCITDENLAKLRKVSRFVAETANQVPLNSRPFVGKSAFAHKGGIHVNAIMKIPMAYEHMVPEIVGNKRRVLVSDLSGKSNIEYKAKELGIELGLNGHDGREIVEKIKKLELEGYQFDVADGSLRILMEKFTDQFKPIFELESFRINIEKNKDCPCNAQATIKISVDGKQEITAAEGEGPVSALDNALRKALGQFFPDLDEMRLVDFKVRVMDGRDGTAAKVRVFIATRDQEEIWNTIGVSRDIIEASWQALTDSFQYKLAKR